MFQVTSNQIKYKDTKSECPSLKTISHLQSIQE